MQLQCFSVSRDNLFLERKQSAIDHCIIIIIIIIIKHLFHFSTYILHGSSSRTKIRGS